MQSIKLLLLFGGESTEHEVSISSARNVFAALDKNKYDITLCYITKNGRWQLVDRIEALDTTDANMLYPVLGEATFRTSAGEEVAPDVILPILHGTNGEDGSVQGLAQLVHVPIVGCGIVGSALCMDKEVAKRLLLQSGLPVVEYSVHRRGEPEPDFADLVQKLGNPLFVKPANLGSSVGVSKVTSQEEFTKALAQAHGLDAKVLIERSISNGRELECAILGNEKPEASVAGEVKPDREFYSYESKYDDQSQTQVIIPADLPQETTQKLQDYALRAYKALECRGLSRIDFFLEEHDKLYINEINTLPGFTNISMYPKLWQHEGLQYPALLDKLIALALEEKN